MEALQRRGLPILFVLVWSSAYVAGAIATQVIAPLTVTLWRFAVAALVLGAIAWVRHERWPRRPREIARAALAGVLLFAVHFGGLYLGLGAHMPAATTALIACSAPLLVASVSAALGWEQLRGKQWLGVALGVVGVIVTLSDRLGRPPSMQALAWTLLGLFGLVAGTLLQGRLRSAAGPAALASVELIAATLAMSFIAPQLGSLTMPWTLEAMASFAYVAIIAGAFGPLLLFALIRRRGALQATNLLFVVPALTALGAWPVLGTPIGVTAFAGFAIAAMGLRMSAKRSDATDLRERVEQEVREQADALRLLPSGRH